MEFLDGEVSREVSRLIGPSKNYVPPRIDQDWYQAEVPDFDPTLSSRGQIIIYNSSCTS
jgi:hypothetical protein